MSPSQIVHEFIAAVTSRDYDQAFTLCHQDMVFENVPMTPSVNAGRDRVRQQLERAYVDCTFIDYEMLTEAEIGGTLLTERVDHHVWDDGTSVDIRVMGRFDVVDGLIVLWRDYYDGEQWHENFEGGFVAYLQRRAAESV